MKRKPFVGMAILFMASISFQPIAGMAQPPAPIPQPGVITHVWTDSCVNIKCDNGLEFTSVLFDSGAVSSLPSGYFCYEDATKGVADSVNEGLRPVAANPNRPLTLGEKAVGLTFNPSQDHAVYACKAEFAAVIDRMNSLRSTSSNPEVKRMASVAITEAQTAQMWAVKALTWRD